MPQVQRIDPIVLPSEKESVAAYCRVSTDSADHTAIVNGILNQYINVSADMELLKANLDRALAPQIPGGEADIRARITHNNTMHHYSQQKGGSYNMPNYVANIVTFDGDKERIKEMLSAIQNDEFGTGSISFDKIIPMPPELDIESSDRSKAGLRAYQDFVAAYSLGRDFSKEDFLHIPGKVEDAYLRMHSGIDRETWDLGRQAFQNNQKYRSPDWYDWRRKHWNTKWDAGGYEEGRNYSQCDKLAFQTAWQEPAPVIHKLSEMYPDIEFTHQWAEEQMVVNCGTAKYKAGVQTECEQVEGYDERKDFSVEVWYQFEHNGLPPEQEQTM